MKALLLVVLAAAVVASAAGRAEAQERSNASLSIQPLRSEFTVDPGEELRGRIRVTNPSAAATEVVVELSDFATAGSGGRVEVLAGASALAAWSDLFPANVTIEAGGFADVFYVLRVPRTTSPGGHYGAIVARTSGEGVNVRTGVASLLLITVRGAPGSLRYAASATVQDVPARIEDPPLRLAATLRNEGNVHVRAVLRARIADVLGREAAALEHEPLNVLPGASRDLEVVWDPAGSLIPPIGRFSVTRQVTWGPDDETVTLPPTEIWVLPAGWIAPRAGVFLAVLFMVTLVLQWFGNSIAARAAQTQRTGGRRGRRR